MLEAPNAAAENAAMIRALRTDIAGRLAESVARLGPTSDSQFALSWRDQLSRLAWCIRFGSVTKRSDILKSQVRIPFSLLRACGLLSNNTTDHGAVADSITQTFKADSLLRQLTVGKESLDLEVDPLYLTKSVLTDIAISGATYGRDSIIYCLKLSSDGSRVTEHCSGQNVVVEFSSPNIAKPFHAGHLRSTILGQFVANINCWFGQNVVRVNYLGDWGTQFGLLGVGFAKYGNVEALNDSAIQHLFEVYVKINKDAEADPAIHEAGMDFFRRMEEGDVDTLSFWKLCRELSIDEYTSMYKRLGVSFHHIHGESMYHESARQLVQDLDASGMLSHNSQTGVGFIDLTEPSDKSPLYANLVKSDGSTLYLTRDVVAAIDRLERFKADKLYYVVENGQHLHFKQLLRTLARLGHRWAVDYPLDELHVKFGRVEGMSTRRGEVVFLRDILDDAHSRMSETMKAKKTTKVSSPAESDSVSETLGVTAILVQDMKEYRRNNYRFSWERIVNFNGDTGIFLQYTHARLHSLVSGLSAPLTGVEPNYACLTEDSAKRLVYHLARFDEILLRCYSELEPCHLVQYLFTVGRLVNVAHDELFVKGQPEELAKTRLVLFNAAKTVVANGMSILGIVPLQRL